MVCLIFYFFFNFSFEILHKEAEYQSWSLLAHDVLPRFKGFCHGRSADINCLGKLIKH